MNTTHERQVAEKGLVSTIHVLKTGEIISNVQDYMKVEDRFSWVDRTYIISKILDLQKKTDDRRRSYIVIYEDGNLIREFINVDQTFKPLSFC